MILEAKGYRMSDRAKIKLLLLTVAVLAAVIAGLAYKFIVTGSTEKSADGRMAVLLAPAERDLVLAEMRGFVAGLQQVSAALARDDMQAVASAAKGLGMGMSHEVPPALIAKLPLEFKRLGFATHADFDQIAQDATDLGDPKHTLEQLGGTLGRCVACHSTYRLKEIGSVE
jgi:hypothetical protein